MRKLLVGFLTALVLAGISTVPVSAATPIVNSPEQQALAAPPAVMPEINTVDELRYYQLNQDARPLRIARAMSPGPAGWDFNWYSYTTNYVKCGSYDCMKMVTSVEEYRVGQDYGVTYQRGYASVRNLGYGITGVKVTGSAYSIGTTSTNQVVKAEVVGDSLDNGTCCATQRTGLVAVKECSFCGMARARGSYAGRYGSSLYPYKYLSEFTQSLFTLR